MCRTTYSSLQYSNTLNYRRMITHGASESVPLSAVNGLSHLTKLTTIKGAGTADWVTSNCNFSPQIRRVSHRHCALYKFTYLFDLKIFKSASHFRVESNRMADSNSDRIWKLRRSLIYIFWNFTHETKIIMSDYVVPQWLIIGIKTVDMNDLE